MDPCRTVDEKVPPGDSTCSLRLLLIDVERTYGANRGLDNDADSELDDADLAIEGERSEMSSAAARVLMLSPRRRF